MKKYLLLALLPLTLLSAPLAYAQSADQITVQDKQAMYMTCLNRTPAIQVTDKVKSRDCRSACKPNHPDKSPAKAQECLDAYQAATGLSYVRTIQIVPPQPNSGGTRGTGNYPG